MTYRLIAVAAATALCLSAAAASAGEGAGDPFPFRAPGFTTSTQGMKRLQPAMTDPFPFRANPQTMSQASGELILPPVGAQGTVEAVNSMPVGAGLSAPAFAHRALPAATVLTQHVIVAPAHGS